MKVSKKIINLETESAFAVLSKANRLASEGKDIINLGIGQPDFPTPTKGLSPQFLICFLRSSLHLLIRICHQQMYCW